MKSIGMDGAVLCCVVLCCVEWMSGVGAFEFGDKEDSAIQTHRQQNKTKTKVDYGSGFEASRLKLRIYIGVDFRFFRRETKTEIEK